MSVPPPRPREQVIWPPGSEDAPKCSLRTTEGVYSDRWRETWRLDTTWRHSWMDGGWWMDLIWRLQFGANLHYHAGFSDQLLLFCLSSSREPTFDLWAFLLWGGRTPRSASINRRHTPSQCRAWHKLTFIFLLMYVQRLGRGCQT